jgi:hypothetical protein
MASGSGHRRAGRSFSGRVSSGAESGPSCIGTSHGDCESLAPALTCRTGLPRRQQCRRGIFLPIVHAPETRCCYGAHSQIGCAPRLFPCQDGGAPYSLAAPYGSDRCRAAHAPLPHRGAVPAHLRANACFNISRHGSATRLRPRASSGDPAQRPGGRGTPPPHLPLRPNAGLDHARPIDHSRCVRQCSTVRLRVTSEPDESTISDFKSPIYPRASEAITYSSNQILA